MLHDYREMLPSWIDEDLSDCVMCLSDDIDSLVACALLQRAKGMSVGYFFDFNNVYEFNQGDSRKAIGVDIAFTSGRCYDNHVTLVHENGHLNRHSANLNSALKINTRNYTEKYAMSTALLVYSLYYGSETAESESCNHCGCRAGDPLKTRISSKLTEEGRIVLLAIDSGYLGHYKPEFKHTHQRYMRILDLPGMTETLDRHKPEDFAALSNEYNLGSKIWVNGDGKLTTDIDLEGIGRTLGLSLSLPQSPALLCRAGKRGAIDAHKIESTEGLRSMGIVSLALTRRNTAQYTKLVG